MAECCQNEKFAELQQVIDQLKDSQGSLMQVMQKAQDIFGYLPIEVPNFIADGMGVPVTEVYGVATFYSQFSLEPKGEHTLSICLGTACYVKGAQAVLDRIKSELGITEGKTTADGRFTLLATRCLGCCGLAPVLTIGEEVYGRVVPDDVPGILAKY